MSTTELRWPDFFIVGAPKCGTTAMAEYLGQHPDIFMPARKEPHFFGSDIRGPGQVENEADYLGLFAPARPGQLVGEASVWYLMSTQAAREIRARCPDARIIIMLRNPVEMLYSLHSQLIYNDDEDITDFAEALRAEPERKLGRRIPSSNPMRQCLFYRETVQYAPQVQRYLETFGRDRVHIIFFDDFKRDTSSMVAGTFDFLGVDPAVRVDTPVVNANKGIRSQFWRRFLKAPPGWALAAGRVLCPTRAMRNAVWRKLAWANVSHKRRKPMSPELRASLQRELAPAVRELASLLKVDLTRWLPQKGEPDGAGRSPRCQVA